MKTLHKARPRVCERCGSRVATGFKLVKQDGQWVCGPCATFLAAQLRLEVNGG